MEKKEKELLLRDLSARLPYNVYIYFKTKYRCNAITDMLDGAIYTYIETHLLEDDGENEIDIIKPYLRPISSMTDKEEKELEKITPLFNFNRLENIIYVGNQDDGFCFLIEMEEIITFLNAHYFDYRGLIEKGLAIAVTEENNPYKE